jgi:tRNA threonylcarbamoyladenosine biosynthesis protein TsaE
MVFNNLTLIELQKLAAELGKSLKKNSAIIGLIGNLGSGKTTFAKALAKSLGIKTLKSPTFIISQRYPLGKRFLFHLDFYRLEQKKQLTALGLTEILNDKNIVIIEWVNKYSHIMRICDILVDLKVKPNNKRDVTIRFKK